MRDLYERSKYFDVITFDVFDTLITRSVLLPEDVFSLAETACLNIHHYGQQFSRHRVLAEKECYKKLGDKVTLDAIYDQLEKEAGYTTLQCDILKNLEKTLELEATIPRREMLQLFLQLYHEGKRIILCSDMYLDAAFIQMMLSKCGYPDDLHIIVSNEIGKGKWSGELWKWLFSRYEGQKILHIGDNKNSDQIQVEKHGHTAFHIKSPIDLFMDSQYYQYLSAFIDDDVGHRLVLGTVVNDVLFNSPFTKETNPQRLAAVWMGPVLGSFIEWLVEKKDNTHLLFVTREGYILKPAYELFCKTMGVTPQNHSLFFASRAATGAATVTCERELEDIFQIQYKGSLRNLIKSRLNFQLPENEARYDVLVKLPEQKEFIKQSIHHFLQQIFEANALQKEAYQQYLRESKVTPGEKFTVVDIGYNGTIQYNLAKLAGEKVAGRYLFLQRNPLPEKLECASVGMCNIAEKFHPIYENLLFLEGILQVPYGQLQKVVLDKKHKVHFCFNDDIYKSDTLLEAQDAILNYVQFAAKWKKLLQKTKLFDIDLAQMIWISMLEHDDVPGELIHSFHLADDFEGNSEWHYDTKKRVWKSGQNVVPLVLPSPGICNWNKYRIKTLVRKYVPDWLYEPARKIWIHYIK